MNQIDFNSKNKMIELISESFRGNIFVTDKNGKIIYTNESVENVLGCEKQYLQNKTPYQMVKLGIVDRSASIKTLKTKQQSIENVSCNLTSTRLVVICSPIFDNNEQLLMTLTNSYPESFFNTIAKNVSNGNLQGNVSVIDSNLSYDDIVVASSSTKDIYQYAKKVSKTNVTIMIYGESGTGKDVLARYIHQNSLRNGENFVPINCAAIPHELIESELFGYEKGAFTGANKDGKPGIFELANKGTLFLDEIGELPLALQSKLLRVLETRKVRRVGGEKEIDLDIRIIAATNCNLEEGVKKGTFRQDLYYRINIFPITIYPLRERPEDIIELTQFFLKKYNNIYGNNISLTKEISNDFISYQWPGNVRELKNMMERLAIIGPSDKLSLVQNILEKTDPIQSCSQIIKTTSLTLKERMTIFENECIRQVMIECDGNVDKASKKLGIHRSWLYKKINKNHNTS